MFGPSESYEGITSPTILVVSFWGSAVTGVIYPDASTADDLFSKSALSSRLEALVAWLWFIIIL